MTFESIKDMLEVSAKLGRFDLALAPRWAKPDSDRDIRIWFDPFITTINIYHIHHTRQSSQISFQAPDTVYSGRILSIPNGFCSLRRMQHIRRVSGVSFGR